MELESSPEHLWAEGEMHVPIQIPQLKLPKLLSSSSPKLVLSVREVILQGCNHLLPFTKSLM